MWATTWTAPRIMTRGATRLALLLPSPSPIAYPLSPFPPPPPPPAPTQLVYKNPDAQELLQARPCRPCIPLTIAG